MRSATVALFLLAAGAGCAADGRGEGASGQLPAACQASDCGPAPGMPSWLCADGTTGGPTGRCLRGAAGRCAWEIRECTAKLCGGIANFPCPDGFECVDDPRDGCDPRSGGADCSGFCTPSEASSSDRTR